MKAKKKKNSIENKTDTRDKKREKKDLTMLDKAEKKSRGNYSGCRKERKNNLFFNLRRLLITDVKWKDIKP